MIAQDVQTKAAIKCLSCGATFVPIRSSARFCASCRGNGPAQKRYRARLLVGRRCACGQPATVAPDDVPHCADCANVRHRSLLRSRRIKKARQYAPETLDNLADFEVDEVLLDTDWKSLSSGDQGRQRAQDQAIAQLEAFATVLLFDSDPALAAERPVQGVDVRATEVLASDRRWVSFEIFEPDEADEPLGFRPKVQV